VSTPTPTPPPPRDPSSLQFERAEPVGPVAPSVCLVCKRPIGGTYFEINGKVICPQCRARLDAELAAAANPARFGGALLYGAGGAALGAAIYYAIRAITGYEIGLVAIVVGILVARGVRKGARGARGRRYQVLALVLTYLSIAGTYAPYVFREVSDPFAAVITMLAAPIIVGVRAPLSLIIAGIALYEAWRLTRPVALKITGPYQTGVAA